MQLVRNGDVGDWRLQDADFLSAFTLPRSRSEFLARRNPVARDARISFDEKEHVYHVDGIRVPRSVTGFLHAFTEEFNAYEAIVAMQHGYDWETKREKYLKEDGQVKTADEIANDWAKNGAVQRARGQLLHYHAEQFLNGCEVEEPHSPPQAEPQAPLPPPSVCRRSCLPLQKLTFEPRCLPFPGLLSTRRLYF